MIPTLDESRAYVEQWQQERATLGGWACWYARAGVPVLPLWWPTSADTCACGGLPGCKPGKHPLGRLVPNGSDDASADEDVVRGWWAQYPQANIGARLHALDVDGPAAQAVLQQLLDEHVDGQIPPGWVGVTTGRTDGGRHWWFASGPEYRRKLPAEPHLEWIGRGYVVAPGSRHQTGYLYRLEAISPDLRRLPPCPAWLAEVFGQPKVNSGGPGWGVPAVLGRSGASLLDEQGRPVDRPGPWLRARIGKALDHLALQQPGTRNDCAYATAAFLGELVAAWAGTPEWAAAGVSVDAVWADLHATAEALYPGDDAGAEAVSDAVDRGWSAGTMGGAA